MQQITKQYLQSYLTLKGMNSGKKYEVKNGSSRESNLLLWFSRKQGG